jgi:oligopeptidase B
MPGARYRLGSRFRTLGTRWKSPRDSRVRGGLWRLRRLGESGACRSPVQKLVLVVAGTLLASACLTIGRPAKVAAPAAPTAALKPPVAPRDPVWNELHGERRIDEYAWMRNRDSPEVLGYLEAENTYTRTVMEPTQELQATLHQEFLARMQPTDDMPGVRRGSYEYYSRTETGKQYPLYCRRGVGPDAAEEILLDLNRLAEATSYLDLGGFEISDDGSLLAYSLDIGGLREYTLYIKDLRTGQLGPERIARVSSFAWALGSTLFYSLEDEGKRSHRVYRHSLGTPGDSLVRQESDARFSLRVWRSRSKAFIFIGASSQTANEIAFVPAARPERAPLVITKRRNGHEYQVEHRGALFYIRTNDRGLHHRLVTAPIAEPGEAHWRELIPKSDEVLLEDLAVFRDYFVVHEREGGLPYLRVSELQPIAEEPSLVPKRGSKARRRPAVPPTTRATPVVSSSLRIDMPEPVHELNAEENPEFDSETYRFSYESLASPTMHYDYHVRNRSLSVVKRGVVMAGYDPSLYRSERLSAEAADGTQIPISLVYRADRPKGPGPLLMEAYGAYGYPYPTTFSFSRVSLLDRGVAYAIAHVRGGGELGQRWHDAGRMLHKRNSFGDFIAATEKLIAAGYTTPDRLAIAGASAGGLLVAEVLNERPELFRAAVLDAPFVDILNTMSDPELTLTAAEYEEWGNPAVPEQYRYLKSYCPYTNIRRQEYPALLIKTSYDDSEVMYWEPAKYTAKLRAQAVGDRPLLFSIALDAGHGDATGRHDPLRERAFDFAFLLTQLGVSEE